MATPNVELVGSFDSILGAPGPPPAPGSFVGIAEIALAGYGSQIPRVQGQAMLARVTDRPPVTPQGYFTAWLYDNTMIDPAGTYYTVTIKDENGDVVQINAYRFTASGYYDLSLQQPYDPNQTPPALPPLITNLLLIVGASFDMVFPGDTYTSFKTTIGGNITAPVIENMVPGNLYTFIIVQDGTGNWIFTWPSNVHNATRIDPAPNSTTVQTFVADETGALWAIGPGTWSA